MEFRDFAFGEGDDLDPGELQMLVERRDVSLIARHAVERLRQHRVRICAPVRPGAAPGCRGGASRLNPRWRRPCRRPPPASRLVSPAPGKSATDLDRRRALLVRGVTGIQGYAGHRTAPSDHTLRIGPG